MKVLGLAAVAGKPISSSVDCSIRSQGDAASVLLSGSLDIASTARVQEQLFTLIRDPGVARVHVDLSRVEFIDSTGLAMLVRLARFALRESVDFGVVAVSDRVDTELVRVRLRSLLVQPQGPEEPGRADGP